MTPRRTTFPLRHRYMTETERFWSCITAGPSDQCWEWRGCRDENGYGTIVFGGRRIKAHRASYLIHRGHVGDGLCVLHRCDNPPCCNPGHLFLGTHAENIADMDAKGRRYKNPRKLPADVIGEVRRRRTNGASYADIARTMNLSATVVSKYCKVPS